MRDVLRECNEHTLTLCEHGENSYGGPGGKDRSSMYATECAEVFEENSDIDIVILINIFEGRCALM